MEEQRLDQSQLQLNQMQIHFLSLPTPILCQIIGYLDAPTIDLLSGVCRQLSDLISDDWLWKSRMYTRWTSRNYPAISLKDGNLDDISWRRACLARETTYNRWNDYQTNMNRFTINAATSSVDAVHITAGGEIVCAGSRDRTLSLQRLADVPFGPGDRDNAGKPQVNTSHQGWVWTISSDNGRIGSGSWDNSYRLWDMNGVEISNFKMTSACLCSAMEGDLSYTGTFACKLHSFDHRTGDSAATLNTPRKYGAVLCMVSTPKYVITTQERGFILVIEKTSLKILHTFKTRTSKPKTLSLFGETLYVGGVDGPTEENNTKYANIDLYKFDPVSGRISFVERVENPHKCQLTGLSHDLGAVYSCAAEMDKTVKIWEPTRGPKMIAEIGLNGSPCSLAVRDDILAVGDSEGKVTVFRPMPDL